MRAWRVRLNGDGLDVTLKCPEGSALGHTVWRVHQLVLQFSARSLTDYDAVVEVEEALIAGLGVRADVDGHDVGRGAMNVFILTEDAPAVFVTARELLARHPRTTLLAAAYREHDSEESYTSIWPAGNDRFDLL
jgi:hypothetical protein